MLESWISSEISLIPEPCPRVVALYQDAEGHGGLGVVAVLPGEVVLYFRGKVPRSMARLLKLRKTQIVAYELFAVFVAFVSLCPEKLRVCRVI